MIIDIVSDLHGYEPSLTRGDLLIIAGDLTAADKEEQHKQYLKWQEIQDYKKIVFIAGNHDAYIQKKSDEYLKKFDKDSKISYLQDSYTEFDGLKIYGTPWTQTFRGMNKKCMAFTVKKEEKLKEKWDLIPRDIDILITHSPPFGIFDTVCDNDLLKSTGSFSLRNRLLQEICPKIHIFGHIHEHGGKILNTTMTKFINASIVDKYYKHVNKPIRIEL